MLGTPLTEHENRQPWKTNDKKAMKTATNVVAHPGPLLVSLPASFWPALEEKKIKNGSLNQCNCLEQKNHESLIPDMGNY